MTAAALTPLQIQLMAQAARSASRQLALVSAEQRTAVLRRLADHLEGGAFDILAANVEDLLNAEDLDPSARQRLKLDGAKLAAMVDRKSVV